MGKMLCKQCGTSYVRPPCPQCGKDEGVPEDEPKRPDDSVLRPSQLKGGTAFGQKEEEENDSSSGSQILLKRQKEEYDDDTPSFQKYDREQDQQEQLKIEVEEVKKQVEKQQQEDEDLDDYKERVRDTLMEVMSLLEKLIDE